MQPVNVFAKLNAMGQEVGKPTENPTSRIGQNNQRQVGVLYGHNGSGKVYNYLASDSVRTGDTVTPEVTHAKSGKTYKTLGKIVYTRDSEGTAAGDTAGYLSGQGIMMKTIGPTDQKSLPGYHSGWGNDSARQSKSQTMQRLNMLGEILKK